MTAHQDRNKFHTTAYTITRKCAQCGSDFLLEYASSPQRFCTQKCGNASRKVDLASRFWPRVQKADGCWLWTGPRRKGWHGVIGHYPTRKASISSSRASWEIHFGQVPEGLFVCHTCDNPICVRPDHLFLGTPKDNIADAAAKGRMQRGSKHHESKLTEEQVLQIRALYPERTQQSIADHYGVSQVMIGKIVRREWWAWLA